MNKKVSPTLIGAFVLGGLALVVTAVLLIGSGRLFVVSRDFILYFDGSVNGLRVGAPVKFKGVEIGAVKSILLQIGSDLSVQRIPVIIRVDAKKITQRGGQGAAITDPEVAKALIDQGLRGSLQLESIVTGLLYVGLDFYPETPANFVQAAQSGPYQEIPTIPSIFEKAQDAAGRIVAKLEAIDFQALINSIEAASKGVNAMVSSPELKGSLQAMQQTMPKVEEAIKTVGDVAKTMESTFKDLSGDLKQTSNETRVAVKQAGETMKRVETTLANVSALIDPDSPTFYELTRSLREVSSAARSLRQLANYLERNPRALIFGKPDSKKED
ncbi:MAG TPA: MlaD family protein [Candidatus Binatia bacterium]|jgi:paraquat-inducible protein B